MASYIIAGKADDPAFARTEFAAKQIEAVCPNVFFQYEMRHPDNWKEFIMTVLRQYDFHGYPEDFSGPLVWTHEGELIGGTAEFVQKVCIEKFGIRDPPAMSDPLFKQIAVDNLKQVRIQQHREQHGAPFAEKCEEACSCACAAGLILTQEFAEKRKIISKGTSMEVWVSERMASENASNRQALANGESAQIDPSLKVGILGQDSSHAVLLHPRPLCRKQLAVVPEWIIHQAAEAKRAKAAEEAAAAAEAAAKAAEEKAAAAAAAATAAAEAGGEGAEGAPAAEAAPAGQNEGVAEEQTAPAEQPSVTAELLEVPVRSLLNDADADLGLPDFQAAMEVLHGIGGIATWTGLRAGSEYRNSIDTHVQVLPFPVHSQGEDCPLRFPLELLCDAALRDELDTLSVFPFAHKLASLSPPDNLPDDKKMHGQAVAQIALDTYEALKHELGAKSCSIAFTTSWMILMPLSPPSTDSADHEVWLQMPPPPACALCGVVVTPAVEMNYPENAGLQVGQSTGKMVSTRAIEERIPEGTPEFDVAAREVRISKRILDAPAEILGIWASPAQA